MKIKSLLIVGGSVLASVAVSAGSNFVVIKNSLPEKQIVYITVTPTVVPSVTLVPTNTPSPTPIMTLSPVPVIRKK